MTKMIPGMSLVWENPPPPLALRPVLFDLSRSTSGRIGEGQVPLCPSPSLDPHHPELSLRPTLDTGGAPKAFLVGLQPSGSLYFPPSLEPMPARGPGTLQGLTKCLWNGWTNIHISLCSSSCSPSAICPCFPIRFFLIPA